MRISDPRPKVYLAGPDVFRPGADAYFRGLALTCDALGLQALLPVDGAGTGPEAASYIYEANMGLLRSADGVVANLQPFRGTEPDSGTVFEVGAAVALGLPVVGYGVPAGTYADRARNRIMTKTDAAGVVRDADDAAIEDFGLPLNLMLGCSVSLESSADAALAKLAALLLRA